MVAGGWPLGGLAGGAAAVGGWLRDRSGVVATGCPVVPWGCGPRGRSGAGAGDLGRVGLGGGGRGPVLELQLACLRDRGRRAELLEVSGVSRAGLGRGVGRWCWRGRVLGGQQLGELVRRRLVGGCCCPGGLVIARWGLAE